MDIRGSCETVKNLKTEISELGGLCSDRPDSVPESAMKLIFRGQVLLDDDSSLCSYGITFNRGPKIILLVSRKWLRKLPLRPMPHAPPAEPALPPPKRRRLPDSFHQTRSELEEPEGPGVYEEPAGLRDSEASLAGWLLEEPEGPPELLEVPEELHMGPDVAEEPEEPEEAEEPEEPEEPEEEGESLSVIEISDDGESDVIERAPKRPRRA